jgi:hypothetical protein
MGVWPTSPESGQVRDWLAAVSFLFEWPFVWGKLMREKLTAEEQQGIVDDWLTHERCLYPNASISWWMVCEGYGLEIGGILRCSASARPRRCQSALKIDPRSAPKNDPLEWRSVGPAH